jgi:hypothetical protein
MAAIAGSDIRRNYSAAAARVVAGLAESRNARKALDA